MSEKNFENNEEFCNNTTNSVGPCIPRTRQQEYDFVSHSYEGTGGYKTGNYLFPFGREDDHAGRKKQVFYRNYIKGVADSLITPVFSTPAARVVEPENDMVSAFFENVDNKGTKIQDFTKQDVHNGRLNANCFAVVDTFPLELLDQNSEKYNIENRLFPYAYIKKASSVYDFGKDDFGKLIEISFFDEWKIESDGKKTAIYKQWTETFSQQFVLENDATKPGKKKKTFIGEPAMHNLGVLPIAQTNTTDTGEVLPASPYYDLCRLNLTIFNQDSEQRVNERNCAFTMLVVPGSKDTELDVGSSSVLWVDENGSQKPEWIAPPADILELLGNRSNVNIGSLLEQANTMGATAVETGAAAKSGVALGYEFLGQNYSLKETAGYANNFEMALMKIFKLYTKQTFEYKVVYSDNYAPSMKDLLERKTAITDLLDIIGISDEFRAQLEMDLIGVMAIINQYDDEVVANLKEAIIVDSSEI